MEAVPRFLEALAGELVPACDPAVVQSVFACASAGYRGPRGSDGLRVTAITPSGVPFEASVSAGGGRSAAALRYVTETATGMPFFGPRLSAQRRALEELAAWLPPPGQAAGADLGEAIDVLFPDPSTVAARTRFATTFGIVHRAEVPDGLAGLKLYGNLRADDGALGRLARRWATFASLVALVDDLAVLAPHFATVEVDAAGRRKDKLYLRVRRANRTTLAVIARRFDADAGDAFEVLDRAGTPEEVWGRRYFVCGEVGDDDAGPELSVHLPSKALGLDGAGMAALARRVMDGAGDGAALSALDTAADRAGGPWETTVVAIGLTRGGGSGKVNVYRAPGVPQPEPAMSGSVPG